MRLTFAGKIVAWLGVACLIGGLASEGTAQDGDSGFKYIEVKVLDPAGQPLVDATVDIKMDGMEFPMSTNKEGKVSLNVPSGSNSRLQLGVKHEKFAAVGVRWRGGKNIPGTFEIPLEKGEPIGGLIHDEEGQPVEGVKIEAYLSGSSQANGKLEPLLSGHLATTDAEGRWQIHTDTSKSRRLQLKLSHPEYASSASYGFLASWDQLLKLDHPLVLKKGITLHGQVTDTWGVAIAEAQILLGASRYHSDKQETKTDAKGIYQLNNVPAGSKLLTVAAQGYAPEFLRVQTSKNMEPVNFGLQEGNTIEILVTDPDGVPIQGVGLVADSWRGQRSLPEKIYRSKTNADGIWKSDSMPADEVDFDFFKRGHMSTRNQKLVANGKQHTVVMPWPLEVKGSVVDAESGLPLEKFVIVQGSSNGSNQRPHWERYNEKQGQDGKYSIELTEPRDGHLVRIESAGYRPGISRVIRSDEGEVTIDFEMQEGQGPSGTVKTPAGKPATDAQVYIATRGENLYFNNGRDEHNRGKPSATTDAQGKYALPFLEETFAFICLHDTGWARLTNEELEKSADITLQAWSKVEGKAMAGKEPLVEEPIQLYFNTPYVRDAPHVYWSYQTKTDGEGKFQFDRVIGEEAIVARTIRFADTGQGGMMSTYSHSQQATLKPGDVAKVRIGGTGQAIRGTVKVPEDDARSVNWNMGSVQIYEQPVQPANASGFFHALGKAIAQAGSTPQPSKPTFRRNYASAIDSEGGFAIPDVSPGTYHMTVTLYAEPTGENYNWNHIGMLRQQITVPEPNEENAQDSLDLGEFVLEMINPNPPAATGIFDLQVAPAPVPAE